MQEAQVQSLLRELDATLPQRKIPSATTKTWYSQVNKYSFKKYSVGDNSLDICIFLWLSTCTSVLSYIIKFT